MTPGIQVSFEGRGERWSGDATMARRGEADKHQPWSLAVTAGGESVAGTLLVTDLAMTSAEERAKSSGEETEAILGRAFGRSLTAELGLRALKSDFSFVVDHRWVVGY